jgi:hypothetical protein
VPRFPITVGDVSRIERGLEQAELTAPAGADTNHSAVAEAGARVLLRLRRTARAAASRGPAVTTLVRGEGSAASTEAARCAPEIGRAKRQCKGAIDNEPRQSSRCCEWIHDTTRLRDCKRHSSGSDGATG